MPNPPRLGQLILARTVASKNTSDDLMQIVDENGVLLANIIWTGKIRASQGIDIGAVTGAVEIGLLSAGGDPFQLWNAVDGAYHFKSYSQHFDVPGSNYTNGASMVPLQLRGRKTTTGAPTTGTWTTGDVLMDSAKVWWLCTVGGTPGTWV